ncbi:uncharacterized protein LOC113461998, partial [Phoenix dactylifera]|uniref:Uncharacterized protein LOC113461998 n=1 Tax=Phoenix dactylifera TaxID=42345 RepID=A0A8B8ZUF1_PHODC
MEEVIDQIGEENIVQVITDNGPQYKLAGQVLMERRPQIFWTPCVAHCIDLILMDIGKIRRVQHTVEIAQRIIRYIYGHTWVISLMEKYAGGEILRPGVTRFATNYIALDSLIEKKKALHQMFVSPEWQESRYAQASTEGSRMEDLVSRQSFWQWANAMVKAIKPLYEVLRAVDSERYPQMDFLYHIMEKAKAQIMEADVAHAQEYIDIIERRWGAQMGRKLHLAAYYLNLRFQYESGIGMDDELLHALRNVIYKMKPDPEVAASCIEEEEVELKYADPIYRTFTNDNPMLDWLAVQQQEPELDEPGSPRRPASIKATEATVDPQQWAERNISRTPTANRTWLEGSQSAHD